VTDDTIVIKAPAGTKARWVRQSQRAGMKLSDWIIQNVERPMPDTTRAAAVIPADVLFSDLKLARDASGSVSFDWAPIERICAASGLDIALFREGPEDNLGALLASWYQGHRAAGGERDPVYEDLIGEVAAEDAAGQRYSHAPGRA
jgi:hypothetical protein